MKITITKAGIIYTLITIFIGVSAVNTGNNLLFVMLSLLLSFMWLSGVFARYNLKGFQLEVIPPETAYAGKQALAIIRLKNTKRRPSFLLRVELIHQNYSHQERITLIFPQVKGMMEKNLPLIPKERGRAWLSAITISSPFPLGLFVRRLFIEKKTEFIVWPKPQSAQTTEVEESRRKTPGERPGDALGVGDFQGLISYLPGVPRKLIHWKSLAKKDELMIKHLAAEINQPILIEIKKLPGADLEEKLSCATYLVIRFEKLGIPYGLNLYGKLLPIDLGLAHKKRALTELALYGKEKV